MEAASTVVIKVKYGDMLRRFNAQIVDEELDLSMDGLRGKILSLFGFAPDTELMLTYIDEDGDVVTLVDAVDLRDVVKQGLNPLRITVKLISEKVGRQFNHSSGSSTPLRSPRPQQPLQNLHAGVSEILKTVPEPLIETLVKLSTDLTSKASSSAPGIIEVVDYFSKVGLSYLGQLSEPQTRAQPSTNSDIPESSLAQTVISLKDSDLSKVSAATLKVSNGREEQLQPEATMENNKVKLINVTEGSMGTSSSKALGLKAASSGRDCRNIIVGKKEKVKKISKCYSNDNSHLKYSRAATRVSHNLSAEKKLGESSTSFNLPSVVNIVPSEKEVNELAEPNFVPKTANMSAPDPMKGDYLEGRTRCVVPGGFRGSPGSNLVCNPGSFSSPNPIYKCPFSGIAVGNTSAAPSLPASQAVSFRSSKSQNDGIGTTFHLGVCCDGCGTHPITGPRFKSKVKTDYDLCSICFSELGNGTDYIRMDRPVVNQNYLCLRGTYDSNQAPTLPYVCNRVSKINSCASKLDSRFIQDVNVIDGTIMAPLTPFTKIWRMRNNGTVVWPQKTQLVWIGGDRLSNQFSVEVGIPAAGLPVDQELDIAVDLISPELSGRYISYWRMVSPSCQKFGQRIWVLIQVDASVKETPRESVRCLNLNLPPVSSLIGPEIINVEAEPIVEDSLPEPDNSKKTVELVRPVVDLKPNNFQEMKFPINDSLLVGGVASSSVPFTGPSVPYPTIQIFDPAPSPSLIASSQESAVELPGKKADSGASSFVPFADHSVPNPIIHMPYPSPPPTPGKKEEEEKLLRELEEMGFKHFDLNKEILRMNEYDLERAVDDLCGVSEWDPILEEL